MAITTTNRNFMEAIKNFCENGAFFYTDSLGETHSLAEDEIKAFAEKEIQKMNDKNEKAKARKSKQQAEDPLNDTIKSILDSENWMTPAEISAKLNMPDVTLQKISTRVNKLIDEGVAEKTEITIAGTEGSKKRKGVAYKLVG